MLRFSINSINSPNFTSRPTLRKLKTFNMVKSKSNKMHLEISNDLELDMNNASISRRNRKSKMSSSSPIKRAKKVSNNPKTPKRMLSAKSKVLAKKKRPSKRMIANRISTFKLKPSILINGKRVSLKAMKMSSSRRKPSTSKRVASSSRRKSTDSRRKASASRRNVSDSRRKASVSRRKAARSSQEAYTI